MVMMSSPVGCTYVYLDDSYPLLFADAQVCMTKVGTSITIMFAYGEDFYGHTVGCLLSYPRP